MSFWKKRSVLKYLAFSAVGTVLFAGEKCMANCPESLDGRTIRDLAVSGEAEIKHQKLILDEGSEDKDITVRGHLMGAVLGLQKGTRIEEESASSMCTYKIHDEEGHNLPIIHVKITPEKPMPAPAD